MTQSSLQPAWYLKPVDESEVCLFILLFSLLGPAMLIISWSEVRGLGMSIILDIS